MPYAMRICVGSGPAPCISSSPAGPTFCAASILRRLSGPSSLSAVAALPPFPGRRKIAPVDLPVHGPVQLELLFYAQPYLVLRCATEFVAFVLAEPQFRPSGLKTEPMAGRRPIIALACATCALYLVVTRGRWDVSVNTVGFSQAWHSHVDISWPGKPTVTIQPQTEVPVTSKAGTLYVQAPRSGDAGVAGAFVAGLGPQHRIHTRSFADTAPGKMNFFVSFKTMRFTQNGVTYAVEDVRVGQSHHGTKNPWWVASPSCVSDKAQSQLTCATDVATRSLLIQAVPSQSNQFNVFAVTL